MNIEECNTTDFEFKDVMRELINIGLGKAAKVISELVDSYVNLGVVDIYPATGLHELSLFSSTVIVQEMSGNVINGKTIFSMGDDELLKLLKHLEVIDESEDYYDSDNLDMILDTYQEIGNIILGNIISSIVDCVHERVEIKLPYISDKKIFEDLKGDSYIVVDVLFCIDKLNANGKLFLINDYEAYKKLMENVKKL